LLFSRPQAIQPLWGDGDGKKKNPAREAAVWPGGKSDPGKDRPCRGTGFQILDRGEPVTNEKSAQHRGPDRLCGRGGLSFGGTVRGQRSAENTSLGVVGEDHGPSGAMTANRDADRQPANSPGDVAGRNSAGIQCQPPISSPRGDNRASSPSNGGRSSQGRESPAAREDCGEPETSRAMRDEEIR